MKAPPPSEPEPFEAQVPLLFTSSAASPRNTIERASSVQAVYSAVSGLLNLQHLTHHGEKRHRKSSANSSM